MTSYRSTNQSIRPSINQPINQRSSYRYQSSVNQPVIQRPTNQSIHHSSTNQPPINQPTHQSMKKLSIINRPTNQLPIDHSINYSINQPISVITYDRSTIQSRTAEQKTCGATGLQWKTRGWKLSSPPRGCQGLGPRPSPAFPTWANPLLCSASRQAAMTRLLLSSVQMALCSAR